MTWRDRLLEASFRGVPFYVDAHGAEGGRRLVGHEFPGRDGPLVQDLGRATESLRIRAYLVGDDYDLERDRLLAAAREAGPGELVHPYLGTLSVRCAAFRVQETRRDGGICTIALSFIESGVEDAGLFRSSGDAVAEVQEAADAVVLVQVEEFPDAVEGLGRSSSVTAAIAGEVDRFAALVAGAPLTGPVDELATLQRDAERLVDSALGLVATPARLAELGRDLIFGLAASFDSRRARFEALLDLVAAGPRLESPLTGLGQSRNEGVTLTAGLFRSIAAAEAARAAAEIDWEFLGEARAARERFQAVVDGLLETVSDGAYRTLVALTDRVATVTPIEDQELPSLERVVLGRTLPALVVAYERFGTRDRDAEIVARNPEAVRHPGRLPAAAELEVLSA
ncbi:MAG: DNA circularization N-terminal domain-containing protein [Planctomycetota bacterium]